MDCTGCECHVENRSCSRDGWTRVTRSGFLVVLDLWRSRKDCWIDSDAGGVLVRLLESLGFDDGGVLLIRMQMLEEP